MASARSVGASVTRRQWLGGALALCASRFGTGCGADSAPAGRLAPGNALERLEQLRAALRQSPDHLQARADAAVDSGDARAIFELVRDAVAVVPPLSYREAIGSAVRFGVGNVLRCTAGTPRERAELLVSLLGRAGFAAKVVVGNPAGPLAASDALDVVYLHRAALPFEPGSPPAGTWSERAPEGAAETRFIDPEGEDSQALLSELLGYLGGDAQLPDLGSFSGLPLVELELEGETTYLNTLLPDAEFGESYAAAISEAPDLDAPRQVLLRLTCTSVSKLDAPITLVEGSFGYDELAGGRVKLSPQPLLPLPAFLAAKPLAVDGFLCGLTLLGHDGLLKTHVSGVTLSALGDVIETGKSGTYVGGVPLLDGGKAGSVLELQAQASAVRAPIIELRVAPLDAGGDVVPGLSAASFGVVDEGQTVSAVLRENGGGARVLVLVDTTGSQPALTGSAADLALALVDGFPGAVFQVVALDGAPALDGYAEASSNELAQALLGLGGAVTSPVYAGLLSGLAAAPTAVVLLSDGDVEADAARQAQCLAALGKCPVLCVGCAIANGDIYEDVLSPIAEASGGAYVDAGELSDVANVAQALTELGAGMAQRPYRLTFQSPGGAGKHTVTLTVGDASVKVSYELPKSSSGALSLLVGVQLHVEIDGVVVERRLVGLSPGDVVVPPDAESLAAASQAVRDFLLSSCWLSFEGGPPTLSAWLEDLLSAEIGYQPVQQAIDANDAEQAYAEAEKAPARPLPSSLLLHAPLQTREGTVALETALRAAVHLSLPLSASTKVDLLPTTRFICAGPDDAPGVFASTLRATLRLAVTEAAIAKGSTLAYLGKASLVALPAGALALVDLTMFAEGERAALLRVLDQYADCERLVAEDGSTHAFWAVDRNGSALGVLPDGSGGAVAECKAIVDFANQSIDDLGLLLGEIDAGLAPTFIVIAAIGKAAAVAVAEAALSFTDPMIDPSILQLGLVMLCSAISDAAAGALPSPPNLSKGVLSAAEGYVKNVIGGKVADQVPACHLAEPCSGTAP